MIWTLLALGLWIVLGGFISYYGDLQGRRWGKRRVSWFGMRPKHTAVLITSLTGGFIALLSIVTLLLIVPTVRDVILRGESAIRDNKQLIAEKARLQTESAQAEAARDASQKQWVISDNKLAITNQQLTLKQQRLNEVGEQLHSLQAQLRPLQAKLALTQQTLDSKVAELKSKTAEVNAKIAEIKRLTIDQGNSAQLNKDLATQNMEYSHQNGELEKKNRDLLATNKELQQRSDRLKDVFSQLNNRNNEIYLDSLKRELEVDRLNKEVAELKQQRDDIYSLTRERDNLLQELNNRNHEIVQTYAALRQGRVSLGVGAELARQPLDAHTRPEAVRKALEKLLENAEAEARLHGAATDENDRAIRVIHQQVITLTGYKKTDENARVDSLVSDLSGSNVPIMVVASTVMNCIAGEPAYVDLQPYRVVRVFNKGAVVASRQIDGHDSIDKISLNLIMFLQRDVKEAAIKAGTIPKVDPATGDTEVATLGWADLFQLMERVRRVGGPVILQATAKEDISSADALNLTFKISRAPEPKP